MTIRCEFSATSGTTTKWVAWIPSCRFLGILALWSAASGCTPPPASSQPQSIALSSSDTEPIASALPADKRTNNRAKDRSSESNSLREKIDQVLAYTLSHRQLNTADHAAWQILHGVLTYQRDFPVRVGRDGEVRGAVDYVLQGGSIDGWTFEPGDLLDPTSKRRGVRAIVEAGTRRGQGHADQWLAILAQCGLTLEQTMDVGGQTFRLADLVAQCQRDVPYNAEREYSWTLVGLSIFVPPTSYWTAADGQTWSLERLVQSELEQSLDDSACGGTHRMIGIATALKAYQAEGGAMTMTWQSAQDQVNLAIQQTLSMQNPDGSFSSQYYRRPSRSSDSAITLGTTGHLLEFLTVAMTDEQLRGRQVAVAADSLCDLFDATRDLALECGALYHATHGLRLYRERVFGVADRDANSGGSIVTRR